MGNTTYTIRMKDPSAPSMTGEWRDVEVFNIDGDLFAMQRDGGRELIYFNIRDRIIRTEKHPPTEEGEENEHHRARAQAGEYQPSV